MARSKPYHTPFPRMTTTPDRLKTAGRSSVIYFCIQKAGNENNVAETSRWPMSYHSRSDDLCGLNLFIYSHICQNEAFLVLAAALLCGPEVAAATPHIALPTSSTEGLSTNLQTTSRFPTMIKVTLDPSPGQGVKQQVFLTVEPVWRNKAAAPGWRQQQQPLPTPPGLPIRGEHGKNIYWKEYLHGRNISLKETTSFYSSSPIFSSVISDKWK